MENETARRQDAFILAFFSEKLDRENKSLIIYRLSLLFMTMFVELLKYWWYCISNGWTIAIWAFGFIVAICGFVSMGLSYQKKYSQNKWKHWKQIIMKLSFYVFLIIFFIVTFIISPFLYYRENTLIKQEIRTLLDSIRPEILQKVDNGQKDIFVMMNIPTEVKILDLAKHPDFNKYLSIKKSHGKKAEEYINDSNDITWKVNYHLSPKDALIK